MRAVSELHEGCHGTRWLSDGGCVAYSALDKADALRVGRELLSRCDSGRRARRAERESRDFRQRHRAPDDPVGAVCNVGAQTRVGCSESDDR